MHTKANAEAAIAAIDAAMSARVRAVQINEPASVSFAEVLFANAPEFETLHLTFAEPQQLVLDVQTVAGVWRKECRFPFRCTHVLRSIAGRFAFEVNAFVADKIKTELGYIDDLAQHHDKDNVTRYLLGTPQWVKEEAIRRGIAEVNAYGFKTTVEMQTKSGEMCRVFFHMNNTNNKTVPYFVTIKNQGLVSEAGLIQNIG